MTPEVTKTEPKTAVTVTAPATRKEQLLHVRKHGKHETKVYGFRLFSDFVLDKESLNQINKSNELTRHCKNETKVGLSILLVHIVYYKLLACVR